MGSRAKAPKTVAKKLKMQRQRPGVEKPEGSTELRPMRPAQCRTHMRRTLAREFEKIVEGFVKEAMKGSCSHLKLATELLQPLPKGQSRRKGPVAKLLEELRED